MLSQCRVGALGLTGEVIRIEGEYATIQVYEETGTQPTLPSTSCADAPS